MSTPEFNAGAELPDDDHGVGCDCWTNHAAELAIVAQLAKTEAAEKRVAINMGPYTLYTLIGMVQLATRHPQVQGGSLDERVLRPLAEQMIGTLCDGWSDAEFADQLRELCGQGWEPANDPQHHTRWRLDYARLDSHRCNWTRPDVCGFADPTTCETHRAAATAARGQG